MELSFKSISLFIAIVLTGLSAGLFYAWAVSVIPGTRKIMDLTYLQSMQSINKEILNPAFFLTFIGSPIVLALSTFQQYQTGALFWVLLSATLLYAVGTFGVTAFGNVPLNDALEALNLAELSPEDLSAFRENYEVKWNHFHSIRTAFAILSFGLSLLAAFLYRAS